jgi:hypothetical protein
MKKIRDENKKLKGNLKKDHVEDGGITWRITLKRFLAKYIVSV